MEHIHASVSTGSRIKKIELVQYTYRGNVDQSHGYLQLRAADGSVTLLRPDSDGQSLYVSNEPWQDPFAEPLDEANRRFVESSGKWELFDVSTDNGFRHFIGATVCGVQRICDVEGKIRGLAYLIDSWQLLYIVEWDEGFVTYGDNSDVLSSLGLHVAGPLSDAV